MLIIVPALPARTLTREASTLALGIPGSRFLFGLGGSSLSKALALQAM